MIDNLLRGLALLAGTLVIIYTLITAIRIFVLPRAQNAWIARQVYRLVYRLFLLISARARTYEERDRALAYFAPVILLVLPIIILLMLIIGYTPIYWALGAGSIYDAFLLSGSSLLTLGYAPVNDLPSMIVSFSDAALGMILVALLIAYLPTIYNAFSQREKQVAMLEVRAGSPPFGATLLSRVYRNRGDLDDLNKVWERWEEWFVEIEENHTSLVILVFFRSPQSDRSWVTAAGAVLDAAALLDAVIDQPRTLESVLCIRAGYISLRRIADFFNVKYNPKPKSDDPISITRAEFDEVYDELAANGVPVIEDRDQAWQDYAGWRVNYDQVLLILARLTAAPYAPWSSDRSLRDMEEVLGQSGFGKK